MDERPALRLRSTTNTTGIRVATYEPNWLLIALPTIFGLGTVLPSRLTLWLLIGIGVVGFWWRRPAEVGGINRIAFTWGSAVLPVLSLAVILRPNGTATVSDVARLVIGLIVFLHILQLSGSRSSAVVSLIDGVGVFLIASVVLTFIGVEGGSDRTAGLENSLTGGQRIIFALSSNLAATPGAAGVFVAAVIPILIAYRQFRFWRLTALAFACYILIASQVRMAILVAVVVSFFVFVFPRATSAISAWLIAFLLLLPFFFRSSQSEFLGRLGGVVSASVPGMSDRGDVVGARQDIWEKALAYQSAWADWAHQVFGYGLSGHTESGAAIAYTTAENFAGFAGRDLITPHNSTLMLLFEAGWLGVAVFTASLVFAARLFARSHSPSDRAALSALIGLALVGSTESGLSAGVNQTIWWLLLGLVNAAFSRGEQLEALREPVARRG